VTYNTSSGYILVVISSCSFAAPEKSRAKSSGCHSISGPLLQDPQTGLTKKNRPNRSILASAFQNAWKQGTMAAEVGGSICTVTPPPHSFMQHMAWG